MSSDAVLTVEDVKETEEDEPPEEEPDDEEEVHLFQDSSTQRAKIKPPWLRPAVQSDLRLQLLTAL